MLKYKISHNNQVSSSSFAGIVILYCCLLSIEIGNLIIFRATKQVFPRTR